MATLEDAWEEALTAAPPPTPPTVKEMIELFGGGRAGRSALAREIARARGIKYESALRNVQRYTTQAQQRRRPRRLGPELERIAKRRRIELEAPRRAAELAAQGAVITVRAPRIRISRDERRRPDFTVTLYPGDEGLTNFARQLAAGHRRAATNELEYSIIDAWDEERGAIVSHNAQILDVDALEITPRPE
jgi:hypothetical protein